MTAGDPRPGAASVAAADRSGGVRRADGDGATAVAGPGAGALEACTHCRTVLAGRYCHACGQDSVPEETAFASWRSQWQRLVRTLRALILHPGLLTQEHLTGGRIRYIPPFTLFLNVVAIFFLFSMVTQFRLQTFAQKDSTHYIAQAIERRAERAGVTKEMFLERAEHRFQGVYTLCLATISLLGYTLLFKGVFRKQWRGWRGPFTFTLHYLAFVFVALPAIMVAVHALSGMVPVGPLRVVGLGLSACLAVMWLTLAARRLFAETWTRALAKGVAVLVLGFVIDQAMFLSAVLLTFNLV